MSRGGVVARAVVAAIRAPGGVGRVIRGRGYRSLAHGGSERRGSLQRRLGHPRGLVRRRLRGSQRGSLRRVRRHRLRDGRGRRRDKAQQQVHDGGQVSKQLRAARAREVLQRGDQTSRRGANVGPRRRRVPAEARRRRAASSAPAAAPHPGEFLGVVPDVRLGGGGDGGVRRADLFIRGVDVGARS